MNNTKLLYYAIMKKKMDVSVTRNVRCLAK